MSGKDKRHNGERERRQKEKELALVSCSICPIVPTAEELFIQSLWYRLKHVAASCWDIVGVKRGYVKKESVGMCVLQLCH